MAVQAHMAHTAPSRSATCTMQNVDPHIPCRMLINTFLTLTPTAMAIYSGRCSHRKLTQPFPPLGIIDKPRNRWPPKGTPLQQLSTATYHCLHHQSPPDNLFTLFQLHSHVPYVLLQASSYYSPAAMPQAVLPLLPCVMSLNSSSCQ